jgi:hypothetical protein
VIQTDPCAGQLPLCSGHATHFRRRIADHLSGDSTTTQARFLLQGSAANVAPYCYGFSTADAEILRAIQLGGQSTSRKYGMGKLWTVSLMSQLELIDETFGPDDPNYNPNDSAMKRIICRID